MGAREATLVRLLAMAGLNRKPGRSRRPNYDDFCSANLQAAILEVYRELGGRNQKPRVATGPWDIETEHFFIELDEEQHFNRYRAKTLSSTIYDKLSTAHLNRASYLNLCSSKELTCLKERRPGYWSKPAAEKEFGPSRKIGDLIGLGSSRLRQRAFYDFIKDISSLCQPIVIKRISVWDIFDFGGRRFSLSEILFGKCNVSEKNASFAIRRRIEGDGTECLTEQLI